MEGNKDEALKCLKMGRDALQMGDRSRALKLITKARRLDPSLCIEDLLLKLEGESNGSSSKASDEKNSGPRRRTASSVGYSEEQISMVREIKRKKDYYDILGVEKRSSVEDVRKAYRKLSLKVHPDKNQAPGAEEAFKSVSKAFQCLSDEETRKRYDLVGSDEPVYERRQPRHGFYEADVDAEQIFRNFFFGGMNPAPTTHFRGFTFGVGPGAGAGATTPNNSSNIRALIQLLPVIFILLLNFLPSSDPIYTLSRSYPYEHRFTTNKGVHFFVKTTTFEEAYPPNTPERLALEGRIDKDYFSILTQNCQLELQRLQWGFIRETPNCDTLNRFQAVA